MVHVGISPACAASQLLAEAALSAVGNGESNAQGANVDSPGPICDGAGATLRIIDPCDSNNDVGRTSFRFNQVQQLCRSELARYMQVK